MAARGLKLVGLAVVLLIAWVVALLALGGFQTGAYGGVTEEQEKTAQRAGRLSSPLFYGGLVVGAVGVGHLVAAGAKRSREG